MEKIKMNILQKIKQKIVGIESYHINCELNVIERKGKYYFLCKKHEVLWKWNDPFKKISIATLKGEIIFEIVEDDKNE